MSYTITWIGQAGYILSSGKSKLVIDPYCSNSIEAIGFKRLYQSPISKGELFVDFVISTHNHGDHLDIETLTDYIGFSQFYGPGSCVNAMQDAGFTNDKLNLLDRNQTVQIGDFNVTAVFANHTLDSIGLIIECEEIRCYFTGDSIFDKNLYEIKKLNPDIIFTCINGKFGNMKWSEAVELSKQLGVKTAIPAHFDMFAVNSEDPLPFVKSFEGTPIHSFTLERAREYRVKDLLCSNRINMNLQ